SEADERLIAAATARDAELVQQRDEAKMAASSDPANLAVQAAWHQQARDEAIMAAAEAFYALVDAQRCASVRIRRAGSRIRAHRAARSREHRARPARRSRATASATSSSDDGPAPPPPPRGGFDAKEPGRRRAVSSS
ncbi:MAG TPA: hypothetical protein VI300_30695, partial [Solirubrobacter sp.]